MATIIHRLEQALRYWEDACFIKSMMARAYLAVSPESKEAREVPLEGPIVNAPRFREHLLQSNSVELDAESFMGDKELMNTILGWIRPIPFHLFHWCKFSRRVFHIDESLQLMLEATGLGDIRWKDLVFPFDSFAITLDIPIEGNQRVPTGDCLLVTRIPAEVGPTVLTMLLLSPLLGTRRFLSGDDKERIRRLFKLQKWPRLWKAFEAYENQQKFAASLITLDLSAISECLVVDSVATLLNQSQYTKRQLVGAGQEEFQQPEEMIRLLVGLCMYLEGLGSVNPHKSAWTRLAKSDQLDRRAISNPAQVCSVTLDYDLLTPEERDVLSKDPAARRAYKAMGFHWRRKHKRRPPRSAPDAEKTIPVKACRVRADRDPENAIAAGTRQTLRV